MNVRLLIRLALTVVPFAAFFVALPSMTLIGVALFGLALVLCLVALVEEVTRCANALERRN